MKTRFKVGDIINYNTTDKSFNYANGDYEIVKEEVRKFSDTNEEFQDLECVEVGKGRDSLYHFCDGSITPNPYLSKVEICKIKIGREI